jgi:hypothetical protein
MAGFEHGVLLLRGEPTGERLAIVMVDACAQLLYTPIDHRALCMSLLHIGASLPPVEDYVGRIEGRGKGSTTDAVAERNEEAGDVFLRQQDAYLIHERGRYHVVRVQRQNPGTLDTA